MSPEHDNDELPSTGDPQTDEHLQFLIRGLRDQLGMDPQEELPSDFRETVMARVQMLPSPQRHAERYFSWITTARQMPTWALVSVATLVLSLSLNGWFGYQTLMLQHKSNEPNIAFNTRSGAVDATEMVLQADYASAAGRYAEAVQAYEEALQASSEPVSGILRNLAYAHFQLGNYEKTYRVATAVLMITPQDPRTYLYRGQAAEALSNPTQAIQDWQQAARLGNPEAQRFLQAKGLAW